MRAVCVDGVCGLGPGVRDGADSGARSLVKQADLIRRVQRESGVAGGNRVVPARSPLIVRQTGRGVT